MFLAAFAGAVFGAIIAPIAIPIVGTLMYFAQKALEKAFGKQRKTQFVEV
jgi:hypothetical protein